MRKIERKCLQCPMTMYLTPEQIEKREFCTKSCWKAYNLSNMPVPCKLCRMEFNHKLGKPQYCDRLCYLLSFYKVFTPVSYESNIKPTRKHWESFVVGRNKNIKKVSDVPQFVW